MFTQDQQEKRISPIDGNQKRKNRKGLKIASTAGTALGLTVGTSAIASAATSASNANRTQSIRPTDERGPPAAFGSVT